jgi:hypothetical protein
MFTHLIHSVADVWIIWGLGISLLLIVVYRSLNSRRWTSLREFARDEEGASYALAYMMAFPVYMLTVCIVVQATMMLIVKCGVMYAAHNAARAAVVWRSTGPSDEEGLELAEEKAHNAAVLAVTPFASGNDAHRKLYQYDPFRGSRALLALPKAYAYDILYRLMATHTEAQDSLAKSKYVRDKFIYASAMTDVSLAEHTNEFNESLSVTVTYTMPIHIPLAGRLMGTRHSSRRGYYRDIEATATLPLETPESDTGTLGIEYDPSEL